MKRAYSTIEIKSIDEGGAKRSFRGIASTPTPDRMGDIVEPKGAQFELPLPLLWQHDSYDPIGWITKATVTDKGIEVEGEIADIPDAGPLRDRLLTAWQYLKSKLVRGLSIGFRSLEEARIKDTYSYHILKWTWLELSAVTIPANQDASITAIKSIDRQHLAALGRKGPADDPHRPGASGQRSGAPSGALSHSRSQKGKDIMKTLQQLREERSTKADRLQELRDAHETDKRKFTEDEAAEFDGLVNEIAELDDEIRIKQADAINAKAATPVDTKRYGAGGGSPTIIVSKSDPEDKFKGQSFTRMVIAKTLARLEGSTAADIAHHRWGKSAQNLVAVLKAGVAGGGTGSGEWGAELAAVNNRYTGDFIQYLYSMTAYDQLPLREAPANVLIKGQDGAATGNWVGESKSIPVSKADFLDVTLVEHEVDALAVISKRLMRNSDPSAELLVRDALVNACSQRVDLTFFSKLAASSGVSPAGMLNGVDGMASQGSDGDGVRADIAALYAHFLAAKNASGLYFAMNKGMAKSLALMRNALGNREFPGISQNGGTLEDDPVVTGDNIDSNWLILLKPSDIYKIGDRGVTVELSDQATIEQDSAPTGASDTPAAQTVNQVSMFQTNSVAIKVTRVISFAKRRSHAVQYIADAGYQSSTSTTS
jgi:HK97 family phage prohead protease